MIGSSMTMEAEKHMDSEIDALFSLIFFNARYNTSYYY
jgi:hypothetical protein